MRRVQIQRRRLLPLLHRGRGAVPPSPRRDAHRGMAPQTRRRFQMRLGRRARRRDGIDDRALGDRAGA